MNGKTQLIRLVDVFALGPFMVYSARYLPTKTTRALMLVSGVATILYNANNYLRIDANGA